MKFNYSVRAKFGVILIMLFALYANLGSLIQGIKSYSNFSGTDTITAYENRFQGLKRMLPSRGVVRYVTDDKSYRKKFKQLRKNLPPFDITSNVSDEWPHKVFLGSGPLAGYFLTQYAISPVILVNAIDCDLVVGNFLESTSIENYSSDENLVLIKDFGENVILFHREAK